MASNSLLLTVLLILVSICLTSGYSHPTRDLLFKQDDESYSMSTSEQGSSMIDVEDLVKARSLQALLAGSKVAVNKAKSTSFKGSKKKKHKSKVGSLDVSALVGIIIAAIVVTIIIICVIYFLYLKHKTKKAESLGQEKTNGSSINQTSKTDDIIV
ncbi:hypothetical protein Rs2_00723 [Raphanus sativus]|uniref:Uncharacterized protein LOC108857247 n=1 Tax=Raphanus sativus TaxID=3726 RepID=A0A6J0NPU5_RAPSA|nr:uncharacterized protein LOC108857247 [Raphanus sativus]KAJ4915173.1 hypothetical protein Rs2_00723 [Raphanus sativus]